MRRSYGTKAVHTHLRCSTPFLNLEKKCDILTVVQRKPYCVKQNTFASGERALKFAQVVKHLVSMWNDGFIYYTKHKQPKQGSPYKLPQEKPWFKLG